MKDPRTEFHSTLAKGYIVQRSRTHGGCWVLLKVLPDTQSKDHDYFCGFYGATTYRHIALVAWQPEEGYEAKRLIPEQIQQEITMENDYHGAFLSDVKESDEAWEKFQEVLKKEGAI